MTNISQSIDRAIRATHRRKLLAFLLIAAVISGGILTYVLTKQRQELCREGGGTYTNFGCHVSGFEPAKPK